MFYICFIYPYFLLELVEQILSGLFITGSQSSLCVKKCLLFSSVCFFFRLIWRMFSRFYYIRIECEWERMREKGEKGSESRSERKRREHRRKRSKIKEQKKNKIFWGLDKTISFCREKKKKNSSSLVKKKIESPLHMNNLTETERNITVFQLCLWHFSFD